MTVVIVVGAGALGQTFAASLAAVGCSVTVVTTPRGAEELTSAEQILVRGAVEVAVPVRRGAGHKGVIGLLAADEIPGAVEGVVFATKAHQLESAAQSVAHVAPQWVLGLQNGIGKQDLLGSIFGGQRVIGCVTLVAAERTLAGPVAVMNLGMTYLGEPNSGPPQSGAVSELFAAAGIPAEARVDIQEIEWTKAANVAGTFGVDLLTQASWSDAMESEPLTRIFVGLTREVAAIADAEGVSVRDLPGLPVHSYVTQPIDASVVMRRDRVSEMRRNGVSLARRSSLQQDLDLGRPTEADVLFSEFVARASRSGLAVPRVELVRDVARSALETHHSES